MEIEIKREMSGKSILIKTDVHDGRLESTIEEINQAIGVFEENKKPGPRKMRVIEKGSAIEF